MGAARFGGLIFGKDASEAFHGIASRARYEHGHGGYSGTIAEKRSFVIFDLPPGIAALDFVKWVRQAERDRENLPKEIPVAVQGTVLRAAGVSYDKYGPAAMVEVKGEELEALRKRSREEFPQGQRVFYVFGWAPE